MHLLPNVGNPDTDPRFPFRELIAGVRRFDDFRRGLRWLGLGQPVRSVWYITMLALMVEASASAEAAEGG